MSKLTEFLHKLVDAAGASSLHEDVDNLEKADEVTPTEDTEKGEEETPNAAE